MKFVFEYSKLLWRVNRIGHCPYSTLILLKPESRIVHVALLTPKVLAIVIAKRKAFAVQNSFIENTN
jgi:hypothetical protein